MIPEPILEAIKWCAIISCTGLWIRHLVDFFLKEDAKKKSGG